MCKILRNLPSRIQTFVGCFTRQNRASSSSWHYIPRVKSGRKLISPTSFFAWRRVPVKRLSMAFGQQFEQASLLSSLVGRITTSSIPVSYTHLRAHETDSYL